MLEYFLLVFAPCFSSEAKVALTLVSLYVCYKPTSWHGSVMLLWISLFRTKTYSLPAISVFHQVCQQDLWGRVHYDVTGKVDDRPSDFNELDLYRHYLIHVEDDLIASCPPSPEYYAGEL